MKSFENITVSIQDEYKNLNHDLQWSFLGTSKESLTNNSGIALITLNPGGKKENGSFKEQPSRESGNIYCHEDWNGRGKGQEPLQQQIQYLFKELIKQYPNYNDYIELMNHSLIGYFISFRSPDYKSLNCKKESVDFAKGLWSDILLSAQLKLIICIDKVTHQAVTSILEKEWKSIENFNLSTGWGSTKAEITHFSKEDENLTLLRFPHLSRYKIFNREASKLAIAEIFNNLK